MSSSTHSLTTEVVSESDIARQINEHHQFASSALSSAAEHALECGAMLLQVKESLPHGEWLKWIDGNCTFSQQTASAYMRLHAKYGSAGNLPNGNISKALAAIASDPSKPSSNKEPRSMVKRGRPWSEILESFSRRKQVALSEIAEAVGMKNDEKVKRYATQWQDASGLVIDKTEKGISIKAGGDAVVAIFEKLPPKTKQNVLQRLHLDEEVVEKKFRDFKRNGETVGDQVCGMLHKAHDMLHGVVQQYRTKEHALSRVTEEQASELKRIYSLIESTVKDVEQILDKGISNGVSKE